MNGLYSLHKSTIKIITFEEKMNSFIAFPLHFTCGFGIFHSISPTFSFLFFYTFSSSYFFYLFWRPVLWHTCVFVLVLFCCTIYILCVYFNIEVYVIFISIFICCFFLLNVFNEKFFVSTYICVVLLGK